MNIFDLGPLYGPVNQDGLPIIGQSVFKELFTGEWDNEWPANVLVPGCQNFTKLHLEDGKLLATGQMMDPPIIPAMWDYDDLQVIVALVYGTNREPIHPSFDLNGSADFQPDAMQKIWSPFWLENTNYGKTMFCVYYWLRTFLLFPEKFEISTKGEASNEKMHELGWQGIHYLKQLKDQFRFVATDKVVLQPVGTNVDFQEAEKSLELKKFEMAVQIYRLNKDNQYALCEEASEAFDIVFQRVIMEILPVFDRAIAITALYQCVDYFRVKGLSPDQEYIDMAKREYGKFSITS